MIEVPFNPSGRHPAPFLDVYLMAIGSGKPALCAGQLDTGAERTVIPLWVADQLQLAESAPIHFEAVDGSVGTLRTFRLIVRVRSFRPTFLTAAASEREPHVLLGRDFSNKYRILLDGRARLLRIEEYPPK